VREIRGPRFPIVLSDKPVYRYSDIVGGEEARLPRCYRARTAFLIRAVKAFAPRLAAQTLALNVSAMALPSRGPVQSSIGIEITAYSFTINAAVTRVSVRRRSGVQPGSIEPGAPALPPGGVTPPTPEKYGTLAARWLHAQ
jgi:hypothetical protein